MHGIDPRVLLPPVLALAAMSGGCGTGESRMSDAPGATGPSPAVASGPGAAGAPMDTVARGQQRFIIGFQEVDRPAAGSAVLQQRLDAMATEAGLSGLQWQRRLAVGADLVTTGEPLDAAAAARLLDVIRVRPDVAYAEADAMATIAPGGQVPPPKPLR